ncbi:MAG: RNA polymerase sigma factor [Planctomycetota bacterium]|nr:RNA polymerase sigma factor [Planctomycetota bacterium]
MIQNRPDNVALMALLLPHAVELTRYIERRLPQNLSTKVAAEDVLQEVWIEAFRSYDAVQLRGENALSRWLTTIARRKLFTAIRTDQRKKRSGGWNRLQSGGQVLGSSLIDMFGMVARERHTPSHESAALEAIKLLNGVLDHLPQDRRHAIQRKYIDEHSTEDIAREMGKSPAAVRSLLANGLKQMRRRLGSSGLFFSDSFSRE